MKSLGTRIKEARKGCNLKQSDIANALNIKNTTVSNWEKDISKPDIDTIEYLCGLFNVSPNYFFDNSASKEIISYSEKKHLELYRSLDIYGKKQVDSVLSNEYERITEQSTQIEEQKVPYLYTKTEYMTGLSAGTGLFVFDDIPTQVISVPEEYREADFVIGVSGNSMEPTYLNGDKVAVKKQSCLNIGEIGVFMINGSGYIKELGKNVLISHNRTYEDISIDESTLCIGKVLGKL